MGKPTFKAHVNSHELESFVDTFGEQVQAKKMVTDLLGQVTGIKIGGSENKQHAEKPLEVHDPISGGGDIFRADKHRGGNERASMKHEAEKGPRNEKREAAMDHSGDFVKSSERAIRVESQEINQKLNQIMVELQKLINSSTVLKMEFAGVNVDRPPTDAGEYHINFFDWLLKTIQDARNKVENSDAWLKAAKGKNSKAHWGKISKKGANTHVTLSSERTVATQSG